MSRFLFFGIIAFVASCGCHKRKDQTIEFRFQIPFSLTPIKDTINIGDTLTLAANFPDSVKEVNSGKYYKVSDFKFATSIMFAKIGDTSLGLSQQPGASSSFKIINEQVGIISLGETYGTFQLQYTNHSYSAKTKIVAQKKGVFCISFFWSNVGSSIPLDFINLGETESGGKKIANLVNVWYIVNNGQTNFELYRKNTKVGNISFADERAYEVEGTYTFVVK